jgi:hypothetical protein
MTTQRPRGAGRRARRHATALLFSLTVSLALPGSARAELRLLARDVPAAAPALDFDLLGEPPPPARSASDRRMARRRWMLNTHQLVGLGLVASQLGTTVVGQLNYGDKFGDANTSRYRLSHAAMSYTTLGLFAATGALALFAPSPPAKIPRGVDRVTVHKIAMFTAAAGMAAQAGLGIYTARRDGYLDQRDFGRVHLAIGYATLAAIATGVGVLVF